MRNNRDEKLKMFSGTFKQQRNSLYHYKYVFIAQQQERRRTGRRDYYGKEAMRNCCGGARPRLERLD
ncbi:hypothetical protein FACS1894216_16770 [Synergistales bacterium]|nr:hypothetical protein FACS1894216_16770 [Synergistales bacterium]